MVTPHQLHHWKCHSLDLLLLLLLLDGVQLVRCEKVSIASNALRLPSLLPPVLPRQQLLPYQGLGGLRQDRDLHRAGRTKLRLRNPLVCQAGKVEGFRLVRIE